MVSGSEGLTTKDFQTGDINYYLNGTIGQVIAGRALAAEQAALAAQQQEAIFESDGQQTGGQASFSGQGSNSTGQGLNNQIGSFTPSNTGTVNGTMDNHIVYSDSGSYSATIKSINADGMQFDLEGGGGAEGGGERGRINNLAPYAHLRTGGAFSGGPAGPVSRINPVSRTLFVYYQQQPIRASNLSNSPINRPNPAAASLSRLVLNGRLLCGTLLDI